MFTSTTSFVRLALATAGFLGVTLTAPSTGQAQVSPPRTWEVRVTGGELVPTGDQRNVLERADMTAAQVSWVLRPSLAITGTFGWARSRDISTADTPKLDVFTSDLGLELRPKQWFAGRAVTFDAFAGIGAGARSYNYRKLDVGATHNVAGYGAVGGEIGVRRVGIRLEVRDYVSGFKPLIGGGVSRTRNDMVITAAVRINRSASR
jgi:hypothetical protein